MKQNFKDVAVGLAVVTGTGIVLYGLVKLKQGAVAVGDAVTHVVTKDLNPASDQNLAYRGANAVIGCADGSCSLGTKIFDGVQAVKGWFSGS